MDVNSFLQLCSTIGIPSAMLIYIYFQREKDKKEQNDKMERQMGEEKKERLAMEDRLKQSQEIHVEKLNKTIERLESDSKEDKKLFQKAIDSFSEALTEQKISNGVINNVQSELNTMNTELKDIKVDLTLIKEKVK